MKNMKPYSGLAFSTLVALIFALPQPAQANPVLANVAAGNASVQQSGGTTTINQSSAKAILNWSSFNVGANENVQFNQAPNGVTLNRINPANGVSEIYGHISSNGQIILVNGAGIYFGPSSQVNVGGLMATTADIQDQNFLNGLYRFDQASTLHGAVSNDGQIMAANGLVALMAEGVSNSGLIKANSGEVILASGSTFTVGFDATGLVNFSIDSGTTQRAQDHNGNAMADGVSNAGEIMVNGGKVVLTAKAVANVLDNAVNMSGVIVANSVHMKNGVIVIDGGGTGTVRVSGKVIATGRHSGGTIQVSGAQIILAKTASFKADASVSGNGGQISVIATDRAEIAGVLSARGGKVSGNGGQIETSAPQLTIGDVSVITSAANGIQGNWLLDPTDLWISESATTATDAGMASGDSLITIATLEGSLKTTNMTLQTVTSGSGNGDITLTDALTWTSVSTLTLKAANNIYLNADISAINGGLTLNAINSSTPSILSGSNAAPNSQGVRANIDVARFNLNSGYWYQNSAAPAHFSATDFSTNFVDAQFVRVAGGDGVNTPYQIFDAYGLQGLASSPTTLGLSYIQTQDIDASITANWNGGAGFAPIGTANDYRGLMAFSGTYNGAGYTITGLTINEQASPANNAFIYQYVGLFGVVSPTGIVENTNLVNATYTTEALSSMSHSYDIGGLVGENQGLISDSSFSGQLNIFNFDSRADVPAYDGSGYSLPSSGGLVGMNDGLITGSNAQGKIIVVEPSGTDYVGGLVGTNNGEIDSSYTNIDLTLSTYTFNETTFALAPMLGRTISADQSYMYGGAFGGVVGVNNGTIKESYSSGVIKDLVVFDGVDQSGNASSFQTLGGFAGYNAGLIQDAYSTTGLYAQGGLNTNLTAGSFVGENANSGVINNVLTTGVVIGTASEFGSNSGLISNSFYDMATTGSNYSNDATAGCFNKETGCAPVNGVAPVNLTQAATYTAAGWDLTNVWHITEGGTLPYLVSISGANAPAIVVGYTTPNANPQASSIYTIQVQGQELSTGANGFYYGLATAPAAIIVPVDPANLPSAPAEAKDHWWNQGMTTAMMESDLNNPLMPNQNIIDYTRGMSEQQQHADLSIVQHTQVNSSCGSSKSLEAKATLCSLSVQVQK